VYTNQKKKKEKEEEEEEEKKIKQEKVWPIIIALRLYYFFKCPNKVAINYESIKSTFD